MRLSHSQSLFWCKFGTERGLAPHCQGGKEVRKNNQKSWISPLPILSQNHSVKWAVENLWWFWEKHYGEGSGNETELCIWNEHKLLWFVHTNLIVWNCISEPSKWFKVKSLVSTRKIMSSWQSVTWQRDFPKTSLENCRSFPVLHTSLLWGGKSQESKQMLLLLGKASLKGTVHTQTARVISAVRLCTKVALVMNSGFLFSFQ